MFEVDEIPFREDQRDAAIVISAEIAWIRVFAVGVDIILRDLMSIIPLGSCGGGGGIDARRYPS